MANEIKVILDHYKFKMLRHMGPITVHTEAVFNEKVWKAIQDFVDSGRKAVWYVITPTNYEYAVGEVGFKGTKKQYEKIILQRYKWLQEKGQEIQLHVHTIRYPEMYMSKSELEKDHRKKISEAVKWMRSNGFDVKKIVFGWWSYNNDSIRIAKDYGLETVREMDFWSTHDFDMIRSKI
jgi:peptidoglycan/xylan/chitin deacetylase (PgdA/CDA1 family)